MKHLNLIPMAALLLLSSATIARAGQNSEARERFRDAFHDCAEQLGISREEDKPAPKLSDEQKAELKDCLGRQGEQLPEHLGRGPGGGRMRACLEKSGVQMPKRDPASGPLQLNDEQKAAVEKCRQDVQVGFRPEQH